MEVPSPPWRTRRRRRWSLVESFHTLILVIRSLSQPLNHLRETFRTRQIHFQNPVCRSPQRFPWHPHQCLTQNTRVPADSPTSAFALGLFSPRSWTYSRPPRAGWVNRRTSPPLCHVLQPLRKLEPWIHGHGVGIRGSAAQCAFSTHPTVSGSALYF